MKGIRKLEKNGYRVITDYKSEENVLDDEFALKILEGRRVVAHNKGELTLDNGMKLLVTGHLGECSCESGDFYLRFFADEIPDNIITKAEVTEEGYGAKLYLIFDDIRFNVAEADGEWSPWYGGGFDFHVVGDWEPLD